MIYEHKVIECTASKNHIEDMLKWQGSNGWRVASTIYLQKNENCIIILERIVKI